MLLQYWPRLQAVSSVIESPPGDTHLHVLDEHRFEASRVAASAAQRVLLCRGRVAEHEARDAWWHAHEFVYGGIRERYDVAATVVRPEVGLKYSTRVDGAALRMKVGGVEVESREVPYAIAEHVLPRLAKLGVRRFFPEVMSESDVTVLGMKRKLDAGVHGDLHCASVCATHRFLPSAFWGGMEAWKAMAGRARALGIEIGAWFAPHFSPHAAIFREHPEWLVTDVNTLPAGGGYGHNVITTADWQSGIFEWVLADIRRWREEGGLDYLFTDSWANLGLVQRNYAAGMRVNFDALGRLYGEFHRLGLAVHSFEGISPFGVSRFGLADLRNDLLGAAGGIVGQNDFGWWVGEEDMAFGIGMHVAPRKRDPEEIRRIAFRLMANRGLMMADALCDGLYEAPAWVAEMNRAYERALPHMKVRRLLAGGAGVEWLGEDATVVWTFAPLEMTAEPGVCIERLAGDGAAPRRAPADGRVTLPAWGVYRLSEPGPA